MKDLTVFILTHNRPILVQTAIESVLAQKPFDFKFIVSDNSDTNETEKALKNKPYFEKINYYHTTANGADRWHDIFSRVETEYFMVFHDDDEMFPDMVDNLYKKITTGKLAAVGGNAHVYINGSYSHSYNKLKCDLIIEGFDDFAKNWINTSMSPFPSYMYSKKCKDVFPFTFPAGKYSDAVFIGNIVKDVGNVGVLSKPLMIYNIHQKQDSAIYDYLSHYYLYRYYKNNLSEKKNKIIDKFRSGVLFNLIRYKLSVGEKPSKTQIHLLFKYSKHYYLSLCLRFFLNKIY